MITIILISWEIYIQIVKKLTHLEFLCVGY